jgi:hypothetical protein
MDPILNWSQLNNKQRKDAAEDRDNYIKSHKKLTRILTEGEWVQGSLEVKQNSVPEPVLASPAVPEAP